LHFVEGNKKTEKMQPPGAGSGPTVCKGKIPCKVFEEDSMTNLAVFLHGDEIFTNPAFGLWMFLSIGAVSLFVVFIPLVSWIDSRRKEREAFYKADTFRRVAESSSEGAKAALEMLQEEGRQVRIKTREGMKIGGVINLAVGVALLIFLHALIAGEQVYLCGLIPAFIGVAMLVYVFFLAPPVE
jgi:hypothetical protein